MTTLAALGVVLTVCAAASAQEACVVCSGPEATYRCTIEQQDKLSRIGSPGTKAIQAVCAQEMARNGGHAKCVVRRDSELANCQGTAVEVPLASLVDAIPVPAPPTAATASEPDNLPKPAAKADGPPRTVLELAERTGASSKKQFKEVGDGVGDAANRTWTCIASLFKKC